MKILLKIAQTFFIISFWGIIITPFIAAPIFLLWVSWGNLLDTIIILWGISILVGLVLAVGFRENGKGGYSWDGGSDYEDLFL